MLVNLGLSRVVAGRGRAPKAPGQRRNHHEPQRGDWTPLPPLKKPTLPPLPKRTAMEGPWHARTKSAWSAWRKDPATGMYGPAEIQLAIDLAYVYEEWVRNGGSNIAAEIRQRQDGLGLSPKGKQDRRWRAVTEVVDRAGQDQSMAEVMPLRIVREA